MSEAYAGRQIVGIDVHRRRSVLVRMTEAGQTLETVRISNDVDCLRQVMARAGESPEVVLEATYGWYWAADALAELGAQVHLAHPLGVKAFEYRRVKNDVRDATDLADLLRMGRLPEAWMRSPAGARAARPGASPRQAGRGPDELEVPDPRHPRRRRGGRADERPVRAGGHAAARRGGPAPGGGRPVAAAVAAPGARARRRRDRPVPGADPRSARCGPRLPRDPADSGRGARCSPRCSSPKSATSPAFPTRPGWPAGPG